MGRPLLVVARHQEDVSWIPSDWPHFIIQKGSDLPNVGREASSYFWYMWQFYDEIDHVAFLQGNPYDHLVNPLWINLVKDFDGFAWVDEWCYYPCSADGSPHHTGLPVQEYFEKWIGPWPGEIEFVPGAQFLLTGSKLREKPKDWYRNMMYEVSEGYGPWLMERFWQYIFGGFE